MTSKIDSTFALIENTIANIDKTAEIIENVLDYLMSTDLKTISPEVKDELCAKLQTALILLDSIDSQVLQIIPHLKFSSAWTINIDGLLQFLDQLPNSGQGHL
jgi:hypothetical protein